MPKLDHVLETALYVDDLGRAAAFYADVLGLAALYQDGRLRAFAVGGTSVLLVFRRGASLAEAKLPGGTIPPLPEMSQSTMSTCSAPNNSTAL